MLKGLGSTGEAVEAALHRRGGGVAEPLRMTPGAARRAPGSRGVGEGAGGRGAAYRLGLRTVATPSTRPC